MMKKKWIEKRFGHLEHAVYIFQVNIDTVEAKVECFNLDRCSLKTF